ncbi:MAG: hypothetical protein H6624_08710 [Bdellovibrionaceae bacterium]|nr:hypothetical protein [Pseudobdellovibrionaceae bacterium]
MVHFRSDLKSNIFTLCWWGMAAVAVVAGMGCTTAKVRIHTNPSGADVFIRPVGEGRLQRIGQTPLFVDSEELRQKYGVAGAVYMEIRKEGHKHDSFFVTELSKIDLNVNRDLVPIRDLEQQRWLNGHIETLFEVRRLVEAKRYDEAMRIIRKLRDVTPYVATIHELEGGIYLLKGKHRDALDSFRLAMKYNPENPDTVKMVRHLERTLGVPREVDITEVPLPQPPRQPASDDEEEKSEVQEESQ